MQLICVQFAEAAAAMFTVVQFLCRVSEFMSSQATDPAERFFTLLALMKSVPVGVCPFQLRKNSENRSEYDI